MNKYVFKRENYYNLLKYTIKSDNILTFTFHNKYTNNRSQQNHLYPLVFINAKYLKICQIIMIINKVLLQMQKTNHILFHVKWNISTYSECDVYPLGCHLTTSGINKKSKGWVHLWGSIILLLLFFSEFMSSGKIYF